jgi:hypothetical protein
VNPVTITAVTDRAPRPGVVGFHLDSPQAGDGDGTYSIEFTGWVMGDSVPPAKLQLSGPGVALRDIPLGAPRPDLRDAYPGVSWAASNSGFRTRAGVLRLPADFQLELDVVFEDETRTPLVTISGVHRAPDVTEQEIQPLLITTLGRTGSTWVTRLLSQHPAIVTYPPFRHEVRVATYWMDILLALAEPSSYMQGVQTLPAQEDWWLGRGRRYDDESNDLDLIHWLGHDHVETLTRFCTGRISAFYRLISDRENRSSLRYFAEKALPQGDGQFNLLKALYPRARELFLVRDFRDMFCSIVAYNRKLGIEFFNRDFAVDDVDYLRNFLGPDVEKLTREWMSRQSESLLLCYEDLVLKPHETLKELFQYLDIDCEPQVVDMVIARDSSMTDPRSTDHMTTKSGEASVGRWRTDLSGELLSVCNEVFALPLQTFGYARE